MLINVEVQFSDDTRTTEYVMSERNDLYHLLLMMQRSPEVIAFKVRTSAGQIDSLYQSFSFNDTFDFSKFTNGEFQW